MIAVFYYEAGRDTASAEADWGEGGERFTYRFQEICTQECDPDANHVDQDPLAEGDDRIHDIQLPPYTRHLHVTVQWDPHQLDDVKGPSTFRIDLIDENGETVGFNEGSSRDVQVPYDLDDNQTAPDNVTVAADSREDANGTVEQEMAKLGVRNWTVRVTHVSFGNEPLGVEQVDTGQAYSLAVYYRHWEPRLAP